MWAPYILNARVDVVYDYVVSIVWPAGPAWSKAFLSLDPSAGCTYELVEV